MKASLVVAGALLAALSLAPVHAQEAPKLKVMGMPLATGNIQKNREQPFFEKLKETTGIVAKYKVLDQTGFEQLRIGKSGLFDIIGLRLGQVSRDEPTTACNSFWC